MHIAKCAKMQWGGGEELAQILKIALIVKDTRLFKVRYGKKNTYFLSLSVT